MFKVFPCVLTAVLFSIAALAESPGLRPFAYDGCTLFPEGTPKRPDLWSHCCFEHDVFYWAGGSKAQRRYADQLLRQCVQDTGYEGVANMMYLGIRAGRLYPFPFHGQQWGNAWSSRRNYRDHSAEDIQRIFSDLEYYEVDDEIQQRLWDSLGWKEISGVHISH